MADDSDLTRLAVSYDMLRVDLGTLRSWTQDAITKLSREMDRRLADTRAPFGPMAERVVAVEELAHRLSSDMLVVKRKQNDHILRENAADRLFIQWTRHWALWVAVVTVVTDVLVGSAAYGVWRWLR